MASLYSQMRVPKKRAAGIGGRAAQGSGATRRREIQPDRSIVV
jgi:hypothetical protein